MVTEEPGSRKQSRKNNIRLQKYLAACGLGSRRACETLIEQGRVLVDGRICSEQGQKIDPESQQVCVDGKLIVPQPKVYFAFNKPQNVICTSSDPDGRKTFSSFFSTIEERIYTVGRLDRDSEGLIIVTNDGAMANRIAHPAHAVKKTYEVQVADTGKFEGIEKTFISGVRSRGEVLKAVSITPVGRFEKTVIFKVVLAEGKNRQLRRMFEAIGCKVVR
ncbi:MAG: rRNA pseudouridine synthase, partial [Lentisphaerae bacterium]|nr:rRNA pseudouridine synthase [Lentisphaerota bacterium]